MYNHEQLNDSGMELVKRINSREVILQDADGKQELWVKSPHYAGYAIIINGVSYEFVGSYSESKGA